MNPIYKMYDNDYIQQQAQLNHINQIIEIQESAKHLKDFCDSLEKIQPQYQEMASAEFCAILVDYLKKHF